MTPFRAYIYSLHGTLGLHFIDPTGYWAHKERVKITGHPVISGDFLIDRVTYYGSSAGVEHKVMIEMRGFSYAQALLLNDFTNGPGSDGYGMPTNIGLSGTFAVGRGWNPVVPTGTYTSVVNGGLVDTSDPGRVPVIDYSQLGTFCSRNPTHRACVSQNSTNQPNSNSKPTNQFNASNTPTITYKTRTIIAIFILVLLILLLVYRYSLD